jgi:hypothetical protein
MRVTGATLNEKSDYMAQVERLVQSRALHGSESLCKLLRYLAKHALDQDGTPPKEYQIATELFGRQSDFDPQLDSVVRVQAGRLRTKLGEYYASEGAQDTVGVDLPRGSYLLAFHPRTPLQTVPISAGNVSAVTERVPKTVSIGTFRFAVAALSICLLAALLGLFLLNRGRNSSMKLGAAEPTPALHTFWGGFQKGPEGPWVIFSNAAFTGRPDLGLRYYDPKRDSKSVIFDHYTGVGEVLGVHNLDSTFQSLGGKIRVKRGSLFTLDDAKNNDLIFIGSPSENLTLLDVPGSQEFRFRAVPDGPRKGNMEIVNAHRQQGEQREYLASPSGVPLTEDFAVITMVHGLDPERSMLILAGTTTLGTQSAVEYVCSEESLAALLSRLGVSKPDQLKPFEALLRVRVARGVPVGSELLAVRKTGP